MVRFINVITVIILTLVGMALITGFIYLLSMLLHSMGVYAVLLLPLLITGMFIDAMIPYSYNKKLIIVDMWNNIWRKDRA